MMGSVWGKGWGVGLGAGLLALTLGQPARAEWMEAKSAHFTVYGDTSESELRARTVKLERFDAALRGLLKVPDGGSATIYIVRLDDIRKFSGASNVLGFYRPNYQGAVGFIPLSINASDKINPTQIMFHEYTHHILLSSELVAYPGWATEGLAEFFSTTKFDAEGNAIVGGAPTIRQYSIGQQHAWSVSELLDSDSKPPKDDAKEELYSRGWALTHYLLLSGKRPGQFFQYINLLNKGGEPLEVGRKVFGNLDKLDSEVEAYIRQPSFPSSVIKASNANLAQEVAVRKLSAGEVAIMPYRLESANGVNSTTAPILAQRARPVASRFPDDPAVLRAMTEIAYDAKAYDEADADAQHLLALQPDNVMGLAYRGRVMAQRAKASGKAEDWDGARSLFLKANRADPNHALPFVLYYDTFGAQGIAAPAAAANGLYRAAVLVPADFSVRLRAALQLVRDGDRKTAHDLIAPAAINAEISDNPYRKLIKAFAEGASADALVAKAKELKLDPNEFAERPKEKKADK